MIAQTNIQLYNQLRHQQRSDEELATVHRAYRLCAELYSGYFQADGKPFVAHSVGVASIMAELNQSAEMIAVALLHNVYGNGDFGDGRGSAATEKRRRRVRRAVGAPIESLLCRFRNLRINPRTIDEFRRRVDDLDAIDRKLLLIDLADYLEKYVDDGVFYYGDGSWVTNRVKQFGDDLIEFARKLDAPDLAEMLREAFARAEAETGHIPAALRADESRKYLALSVPLSCRRRWWPRLRPRLVQTGVKVAHKLPSPLRRVARRLRGAA